jgi:allophanate hydrolase subunit 2
VGGTLGGFNGRQLAPGDVLEANAKALENRPRCLPEKWIPKYPSDITLRAIPGPQDGFFGDGMMVLFGSQFMVTPRADRMGYRLQGPLIERKKKMPKSIVSEPSMPGGIQIPADKQPIILLVEQTVGGYAKIATVISVDVAKIAQATPGDMIRFEKIDLDTAHGLLREQEEGFGQISALLS